MSDSFDRVPAWQLAAALLSALLGVRAAGTQPADLPQAGVELGHTLFVTQWVAISAPGSARGLGPLFNASSCDACHNGGTGGHGPQTDGPLPGALVVQLECGAPGTGDPVYGRVLNTQATAGVTPEAVVTVSYAPIYGYYYPEGTRWQMRVPHYRIDNLAYGPLATATIIRPRLAPALFGVGLLEALPQAAPGAATGAATGRFGWQAAALSLRDQTTRALAQDMGLTSDERPHDDCTAAEQDCLAAAGELHPEVSAAQIDAIVAYLVTVAVPPSAARADDSSLGARLFAQIGCADCHRPRLPAAAGSAAPFIYPYTDLRLHDLGVGMADATAGGTKAPTRWRTAPLWGLAYRLHAAPGLTLLHDGRAQSVEEAILWHAGEGARARRNFVNLIGRSREALLRWVESL